LSDLSKVIQQLKKHGLLIGIVLFSLMISPSANGQVNYTIKEIKVKGNVQIETVTILYNIKSTVGKTLDLNQVRRDIKTLYKTGFFNDVSVHYELDEKEIILIYEVEERPLLSEVLISGAEVIPQSTLKDELTVKMSDRYDPVKVKESANKIEAKYHERGYNFIAVTPRLTPSRTGSAALLFSVDEGTKVLIKEIRFHGNNSIMAGTRFWGLRSKMKENREHWWMSWATNSGKLEEDLLKDDLLLVEEFYKDRGFLNVSIGEPKIAMSKPTKTTWRRKPKRKVTIDINVTEGNIYRVGKIDASVSNETIFPKNVVMDVIQSTRLEKYQKFLGGSAFFKAGPRFEEGKTYSYSLENEVKTQLADLYGMQGYIYALIDVEKTVNEQNKTVDLFFKIEEGDQTFLHKLEFAGNSRTRDRVLRRNFTVTEGSVFNTAKIKQSIARIQYLGYIDEVTPEIKPQIDPKKVDVVVNLNDSKQTELQLAGGYSAYERFYGMFGISEHNLFGRGQDLNFSNTLGKRRQTFQVSFTDEWLFDRPYYGSVSVWNTVRDYDYSKNRSRGGSLTTGRALGYNFSTRLGYKWEINTVYDVDEDADEDIQTRIGDQITSSVTTSLIYDSLDNRREPSTGSYGLVSFEYAGGAFGGDNDFYKSEMTYTFFKSLPKNLVFSLEGEVNYGDGWNGDDLPFYERFLLGGPNSVRGYRERSIGPWDEFGQNLGGNKALRFCAELHIPIAGPLKTILFIDAGDSYAVNDSIDFRTLRPSTGLEVRFFVPGFWIPLRFIWGYNLDPLENEDVNDFQFAMGTFL
jgi:outer membrane protein insertion porin family